MSEAAEKKSIDLGAAIHAAAGVLAIVLGALMYFYGWAVTAFAALMILSFVSAVLISWRMEAWVRGHWLAMAPVIGIVAGYAGVTGGFTFAYICLWLAFGHFVYRGIQASRAS